MLKGSKSKGSENSKEMDLSCQDLSGHLRAFESGQNEWIEWIEWIYTRARTREMKLCRLQSTGGLDGALFDEIRCAMRSRIGISNCTVRTVLG